LIEEHQGDKQTQSMRLVDEESEMDTMKVSNRQWESAVNSLVQAHWIRSEILEDQGKV
jgi:hypothetical protein